jgi:hypothetical protein
LSLPLSCALGCHLPFCSKIPLSSHHPAAPSSVSSDEKTLIDVLTPLDAFKVDLLARTYEGLVGKSLKETLEKELSGW